MPPEVGPPVPDAPRVDRLTGVPEPVLVDGMRRGDPACMTTLFRAYFPVLVPFVRRYTGSVDEAEELVAALFARLWERRAEWRPKHTIESYLFAAVRNAALNTARAARREARRNLVLMTDETSLRGRGAGPSADVAESNEEAVAEMHAAVARAIAALPESGRLILELRWERHMSYAAIAEVLGSTPGAVQRQHSRTLMRLRALVERANG